MTWVIADHVAAAAGELSVTKGQQVEVVEVRGPGEGGAGDWCLVRMPTSGSAVDSPPPEGIVPLAVLKQPPPGCLKTPASTTSPNHPRRPGEHDALGKYPACIVCYIQN